MLDWIGKKKKSVGGKSSSTGVELATALNKNAYYPGETLYGAAFIFLGKSVFSGSSAPSSSSNNANAAGAFGNNTVVAANGNIKKSGGVSSLRVVLRGKQYLKMGVNDNKVHLYHQQVILYPPNPTLPIPVDPKSSPSILLAQQQQDQNQSATSAQVNALNSTSASMLAAVHQRDFHAASMALQQEGSYIYPFRVPLPAMLPWTGTTKTPPMINLRSSTRYTIYIELQMHNGKSYRSEKMDWVVLPLPMPFWRWSRLKSEDSHLMPEERRAVISSTVLPVSQRIRQFARPGGNNNNNNNNDNSVSISTPAPAPAPAPEPSTAEVKEDEQKSGKRRHHRHRHRSGKHSASAGVEEDSTPMPAQVGSNWTPPTILPVSSKHDGEEEDEEKNEGRRRKHRHHRHHRHRSASSAASDSGALNPAVASPSSFSWNGELEEYNDSVLSFDTEEPQQSIANYRFDSKKSDEELNQVPWETNLAISLRTSVLTKVKVQIPMKLSSIVLVPGKPLTIDFALNPHEDSNITLLHKIKVALQIKSTYQVPSKQKYTNIIASESTGTLKMTTQGPHQESIRLVIPPDTPLSFLSSDLKLLPELEISFVTHFTLKDLAKSVKIPIVLVAGVNRKSFTSRRLELWTNNFMYQSLDVKEVQKGGGSGGIAPPLQQGQRRVSIVDPRQMELVLMYGLQGSAQQSASASPLPQDDMPSTLPSEGNNNNNNSSQMGQSQQSVSIVGFSSLTYAMMMRVAGSDDPNVVTFIPAVDPASASKSFDPNPFQQIMMAGYVNL